MHYVKGTLLVVLVAVCSLALANEDDTQKVDAGEGNTVAAPTKQSGRLNVGDLSVVPPNLMEMLTQGGAVLAGFFAIAALAVLIVPTLSSTRFCHLFGNCDATIYQAYSAPNSVYSDYQGSYGQGGTYNNPNYQKRSIEYIAPVLKAIGTAYDKYNHAAGGATAKKAA